MLYVAMIAVVKNASSGNDNFILFMVFYALYDSDNSLYRTLTWYLQLFT
jgi:hypothetical protein